MKKILFGLLFFTQINLLAQTKSSGKRKLLADDSICYQMKKVADWQWQNLETQGWKNPKKDWTSGAMYAGMMAWAKLANDEQYYNKLKRVGADNKWDTGSYRYFADDYCVGQLYSQLYTVYKNPEYIRKFKALADTIVTLPHLESLEWKNNIYTREWAWCDAMFMGPPALGYLTQATGDAKYLNKSIELWWKSTAYLYDKDECLFYRDSRYFNKKEKNGAKVFWSRGNGWVIGGLARLLSVTPENHPQRNKLVKLFTNMASKLASLQQADGSWHASLLDPGSYPTKETSGTGFICYAMAWGINNRIIPAKKYKPVVSKAWDALKSAVHPDGKLGFVQAQGAAPDKVGYEDTDVFGVGAFLLAGSEMFRLSLTQGNGLIAEAYNGASTQAEQTIKVAWPRIVKKLKVKEASQLIVRNAATGEIVPLNTSYEGEKITGIHFNASLNAGTNQFFEINTK
ncbi:glycoside hydrolase [Pedobacter sp. KBW01]|uniref:glycoside hydrolase family 88/105 protein n=1 Tax=Pedobacter sp. KBW01 TaxID=2153364 RepID=UPI000F59CA2A|nr:glycoside hydrolase family 88 protein [Pedobacter sp. KBW01]RQO64420.1 glycoside hydrolase [Pedobacter sp. KBW01]